MSNQLTERDVLQKLDISDFRHVTKDKLISFASMLQYMEPEVAKKALEQFPDFAKLALDVLVDYKEIIEKALNENSESSKQCFYIYNEVVDALKNCLANENLTFEEKKYFIEKMIEIAKMAESKDSENKDFNWELVLLGATAALVVVGVGASILGGTSNLKSHKIRL